VPGFRRRDTLADAVVRSDATRPSAPAIAVQGSASTVRPRGSRRSAKRFASAPASATAPARHGVLREEVECDASACVGAAFDQRLGILPRFASSHAETLTLEVGQGFVAPAKASFPRSFFDRTEISIAFGQHGDARGCAFAPSRATFPHKTFGARPAFAVVSMRRPYGRRALRRVPVWSSSAEASKSSRTSVLPAGTLFGSPPTVRAAAGRAYGGKLRTTHPVLGKNGIAFTASPTFWPTASVSGPSKTSALSLARRPGSSRLDNGVDGALCEQRFFALDHRQPIDYVRLVAKS